MNLISLDLQLKLLRLAKDDSTSTFSTASKLSDDLLSARFKDVLLSTYARSLFSSTEKTGTEGLWNSVGLTRSDKAVSNEQRLSSEEEQICRLVVAIACLHAFVQLNWTGPALNFTTKDLLAECTTNSDEADLNIALHNATIPLLALDGEPAYHLAQEPTLLLFALRIIETLQAESSENLVTLPWWTLRIGLVHRALLDEPVNFSSDLFSSLDNILSSSNPISALLTADDKVALHTEIGLANHLLGMDKQASERFLSAAKKSGLEWALTGALGKRTKFQVKELSQLVLVAKSRKREGEEVDQQVEHAETAKEKEEVVEVKENGTDEEERVPNLKLPGMPETLALNDDTLLEQTQFTSSSLDYAGLGAELAPIKAAAALPESLRELNPQDQPALHPLDQALLIDMCLAQHNNTPENGLTASQMAPFLARVLTHPKNWSVHTTALLLRARLESKRSRTIERSALQLQALVDQMPTADSEPSERLRYFHQLPLVSKWEMERELAVRFLGMGVVRTALEIFERLEMWEEAVRCHHSMEDTDKAIRVVKDLLEGKKAEPEIVQKREKVQRSEDEAGRKETKRIRIDNTREAKLWCLLGDLEPDNAEAHYEKAWEVSKGTSSRSQRSLGGIYLTREEFTKAIPKFQAALKINPLYARTWFALGCCLLREERLEEAREAFSRNVAVEEDDAEAWNNLAAVYLRLTREIGVVKADDGEVSPSIAEIQVPAPKLTL
jgi:tetratricopeptide (TPR) repeat protein